MTASREASPGAAPTLPLPPREDASLLFLTAPAAGGEGFAWRPPQLPCALPNAAEDEVPRA